jgi:hypothetical protein
VYSPAVRAEYRTSSLSLGSKLCLHEDIFQTIKALSVALKYAGLLQIYKDKLLLGE